MGCLSSKEKYRVYEKESERRIKSYRTPGKPTNGYHSQTLEFNNETLKNTKLPTKDVEEKTRVVNDDISNENTVKVGGDSDRNKDSDKANETGGFTSRNQFDRASQLRRSRKKRRKSDAGNTSDVTSPGRRDTSHLDTSSLDKENNVNASSVTVSKSIASTAITLIPKTASDIVKEECKVLSDTLDNSQVSVVSRLHEKTFSRAEYSSNYGNLI